MQVCTYTSVGWCMHEHIWAPGNLWLQIQKIISAAELPHQRSQMGNPLPFSPCPTLVVLHSFTVFAYPLPCSFAQIQVILDETEEYEVEPCKGCKYTSCLCTDEAKTYSWNVIATKLGKRTQGNKGRTREQMCWWASSNNCSSQSSILYGYFN